MSLTTEVHRFEVRLESDQILFRAAPAAGTAPGDWVPALRVDCARGRHVLVFELVPESAARFSYQPIHWLDHGPELTSYHPIPCPACMRTQRDRDDRVAIWNDNLNYPVAGAGEDEVYGFVLTVVGPEGVVVGSSDPTIVNKPDPGPGAGR